MLLENLKISNAAGMVKTVGDVQKLLETPVTAIVVGSITVHERAGNPEPRFWIAPDGSYALNSLGLPNPGAEYYRQNLGTMIGMAHDAGKKLVVSIAGLSKTDWRDLAELCGAFKDLDGIEVNTGCPNVWVDGERKSITAFDIAGLRQVSKEVTDAVSADVYLSAKLSPYWGMPIETREQHMFEVAELLVEDGFNAAIISNTVPDVVPPVIDGKRVISMETAGKSGPALLEESVGQVSTFVSLFNDDLEVFGVGGITSGAGVQRYVKAGARGVQVGTHFFQFGAKVFSEILQEYDALDE